MTREEGKDIEYEVNNDMNAVIGMTEFEYKIDKIYNDFESRTCENCKLINRNGYCLIIDTSPNKNFGCNRFERERDE